MRQNNGSSFIDHLGNNHNADFATRLHGVRTFNALMGIRDFLELLKTLYVTFEAFFASARTSGGNGIGGLDQNIEHAIRLDIGMVRLNRVNDFGPFTEATSKVGTDNGMGSFDFMVDSFAEVMKQTRALSRNRIKAELRSHNAAQVRDLERMVQDALAKRGAESKATKRANKFRVQVMDANVERRLLASLLDLLVHELFSLRVHLFDAGRVDAAVSDEVFHGNAADLATNGIETRNGNALRSIVDEQIHARKLLEAANIAALATNDAALQIIGRNVNGFHRSFSRVIGSDALNGEAQESHATSYQLRPWCAALPRE